MPIWDGSTAKLIVVDPRRIGFAVKADCCLPVRPGTDAALAMALTGVMVAEGWFDAEFVRDWTNGPFLVRDDSGALLRAEELASDAKGFVAWDEGRGAPSTYDPSTHAYNPAPARLMLSGRFVGAGRDGPIACRPAFDLYAAQCGAMSPEIAAGVTGVEAGGIRDAAGLLWQHRPVAHFT